MRSTKAIIHLDNLIKNFKNIQKECNGTAICAAVKADGYGHGALEVAKTLANENCNFFGVATIYEAEELINGGIKTPIILFSLPTPEEISKVVDLGIEPILSTLDLINSFEEECIKQTKVLNIHLKIDTGMGRIGCTPEESVFLAQKINDSKVLNLRGVCTHLSVSELENQEFTNKQLDKFISVITNLNKINIYPEFLHAANSGAILMNKNSIFNLVRAGISLYGYPPTNKKSTNEEFYPVLELKTKVVSLKLVPIGTSISYGRTYITKKPTYIATLPIGYADGYFRTLSNIATVSINGKNYPIVGNICMDQLMVEVDDTVKLYDEVILIGINKDQPNAKSLGDLAGTISYEVLTNIHRVKRYYMK